MIGEEGGKSIREGDDGSGSGVGGDGDMYKGSTELVLVLLSDSYSKNNKILVYDSRYSSYPAYTSTDYFIYQLLP